MKTKLVALAAAMTLLLAACGGSTETSTGDSDTDDPAAAILDQFGIDVDEAEADDGAEVASEPAAAESDSGATVQVGDLVLQVSNEGCLYSPGFFQFGGIATEEPGTPFIDISGGTEEDYDEDGVNDRDATVSIDYTWLGSSDEPRPELQADVVEFSSNTSISDSPFEFTIDGNTMSGSGQITDYSGVLIPFGETADFTFTATC